MHPRLYASNQFTFFEEKVKPIVQIDRIKPNNQKVEGFKKDAIIQVRNHKMRTQKNELERLNSQTFSKYGTHTTAKNP